AARWPANALAREARLKSAQAWEAAGEKERASAAYLEFAQKHPADDNADEAWLKAADLADSAGQGEHADNCARSTCAAGRTTTPPRSRSSSASRTRSSPRSRRSTRSPPCSPRRGRWPGRPASSW